MQYYIVLWERKDQLQSAFINLMRYIYATRVQYNDKYIILCFTILVIRNLWNMIRVHTEYRINVCLFLHREIIYYR